MKLSDLIRKREAATGNAATTATVRPERTGTVANVASVAVADRLLAEEQAAIRMWLAHIKETDPVAIAELMEKCAANPNVRDYCLAQARLISEFPN